MANQDFGNIPMMWKPPPYAGQNIKKFMNVIQKKYNVKFDGYWDLHKWSTDNIPEFWSEIWDYSGIIYSKKYKQIIDLSIPMDNMPKWFEGAELNYAENLLKYRDDETALILAGEERETETVSYKQLYEEACVYAAAFRKLGLKKGDIVSCYMSNRKEAVIAMLATISIGGIWAGALPMMGSQAVLNRFSQIKPKFFLSVDRFPYNKVDVPLLENIKKIADGLPSLEKVIIVPSNEASKKKDISKIRNSCFIEEFLALGREKDGSISPMKFEQVSMSHPIYLSFTSGTTGLPKPLTHGTGMLLSAFKSYGIQCDSNRDSVWLSMSPVGWATWSIFNTLLFLGIKMLLFEGSPYFLSPTSFWDIIDEFKISHLFLPTNIVDQFERRNYVPTAKHSLTTLKSFLAGGSAVKPTLYDFMYKVTNGKVPFSSGYGLTELMGSPFLMEQTLPVHKGEINCVSLGYKVECLNEKGEPVVGETGELAVTKPAPNLMLALWGDTDGTKIKEKYFSKYPGIFLLGDHGYFNPVTKGLRVSNRSDDTLKQRGTRFGPSEIYNVVEDFPEVLDSLCVSHYNKLSEERAVLFLKMRIGHKFSQNLVDRLREAIKEHLTASHIPDIITEVEDIPYNINGKKLEALVKNVINNRPYNEEVAKNPSSIKCYINREELKEF